MNVTEFPTLLAHLSQTWTFELPEQETIEDKILELESKLRQAKTYEAWREIALALDRLNGPLLPL